MDEKKEVEEEPLELEFWQNPERGKVERDDDEVVSDRTYDPDFGKPPRLEHDDNQGEIELEEMPNSPSNAHNNLLNGERDSLELSQSIGVKPQA